jgi:hypothetical protein
MTDNVDAFDQEDATTNGEQDISSMSYGDLNNLLESLELTQYKANFIDNDLTTLKTLSLLNEQDLEKIGIESLGHRKQIMAALDEHKPSSPITPETTSNVKSETIIVKEQSSSGSGVWTFVGILLIILLIIVIIGAMGL